jgi:hypothetical protein
MDRAKQPPPREATPDEEAARREEEARRAASDAEQADPNPPHTTRGNVTAPKFGSAGSGGAELEPGPPRP